MPTENKWGDGFVRWKEFISLAITMVVTGASLFGYILSIAIANPHPNVVQRAELIEFKERLTRQEIRYAESMRRIEDKLDKIIVGK